jgi:hypothetical protein
MKYFFFILTLSIIGCSSDGALIEQYPQCYHQYRTVFDKCIQLNRDGQKIDATRTEQLLKEGKLP